jgi:hypothetical protein
MKEVAAKMIIAMAKEGAEKEIAALVDSEGQITDLSQLSYDIIRYLMNEGKEVDVRRKRLYVEGKVSKFIKPE